VKTKLIITISIAAMALMGCNRRSQLLYVQNLDPAGEVLMARPPEYKLQPGDILFVQLITPSPEISQAFNNPTGSQYMTRTQDESSLYLSGYTISNDGTITLPFLGEAKVVGLNLNDARSEIQTLTEKMYKDASVIVKLASFKVTVVGEVRRPGNFRNFNDQLNIFEALAQVGDISENGDRKNVLVVRQTGSGSRTFRVDLTDKSVLASEAFYLLPNDVIIVEPMGNKVFQMNVPYITLTFSTISTLILLYNFITRL
jgi:polysaccharide export outer membrane protein